MQNQELEQVGGPGMKKKEQTRGSLKEEMAELAEAWEWSTKEWEESNTSFLVREMNKKTKLLMLWIKIRQENWLSGEWKCPREAAIVSSGHVEFKWQALKYDKTIMSPWGVSWGWYQRKRGKRQSASEIEKGKSRFEWMNWQQYSSHKELSLSETSNREQCICYTMEQPVTQEPQDPVWPPSVAYLPRGTTVLGKVPSGQRWWWKKGRQHHGFFIAVELSTSVHISILHVSVNAT